MSLLNANRRHVPRVTAWRGVWMLLLVALVAVAPVARAICDLQHIATVAAGVDTGIAQAHASTPGHDHQESCCIDGSVSMTPEARTAAADGAAGSSLPALHVGSSAYAALVPSSARFDSGGGRPSLPPYEPPFRRVRKLLI